MSSIGSANSDPIEMTKVNSGKCLVHSAGDTRSRRIVTLVGDFNVDCAVVVIFEDDTVDERQRCVLAEKLDDRIHEKMSWSAA